MDKIIDGLGDYIFLIAIIASFVISAVKGLHKQPKKDLAKTTLPEGIGQERDIPEKKAQVSQPNMRPVVQEPYRSKTSQQTVKKEYDVWANDESEITPKAQAVIYHPPVVSSMKESSLYKDEEQSAVYEDDITKSLNLDFKNTDELKKAVIYSEILQRKYS